MSVSDNFSTFIKNLKIDTEKRSSISYRYKRITKQLNINFYNSESDINHSRYLGSYGRGTAISGFSDLDMMFRLPYEVYVRINNQQGNGQSSLLQEVRDSIKKTYSSTSVSGDGQVLVIIFTDDITFEILPTFLNKDGSYTYPDSSNGGSWKTTNPLPEIQAVDELDEDTFGNLRNLCKMARAWKNYWSVPISGLLIDTLAYRFIQDWKYKENGLIYYDWMSRDFFLYLSQQNQEQQYWYAPGSNQLVHRKGLFEYKAKQCYNKSLEAIQAESNQYYYTARSKWREIYGSQFPS